MPTRWRLCDRSVCHSVNRITDEWGNGRWWHLAGTVTGDPLEVINSWWWSGSACGFLNPDHFHSFFYHCVMRYFLNIFQHFSYNQQPLCIILGEMTDADKIMHPLHFGTDPTDIRIQINPKIRIRVPSRFCFKFWHWQRFTLSECSCFILKIFLLVCAIMCILHFVFCIHNTCSIYRETLLQCVVAIEYSLHKVVVILLCYRS